MQKKDDKMLTTETVAERLGVAVPTVRHWLRNGKMRGIKLGPRLWRVRESDLEKFVANGLNEPEESTD